MTRVRRRDLREQAIELRRQGLTYQAIGDALGVTKQRAHQLVASASALPRRVRGRGWLSEEEAAAIRQDPRKQVEIAADYGVTQTAVSYIKNGHRHRKGTSHE